MAKTNTLTIKKILYGLGITILLACLSNYLVYGYIKLFCGERFEHHTFYVGTIETAGGEKTHAIKVRYNKNIQGNGYECFEISFSDFFDTDKKSIETQGLQYIANSIDQDIEWFDYEYLFDKHKNVGEWFIDKYPESITMETLNTRHVGLWEGKSRAYYFSPFINEETTSRFEYQSTDGAIFGGSTNPITSESYMLLQTGENPGELIGMKFKYDGYVDWLNNRPSSTGVEKIGYYESKSAFHNHKDYFYNCFSVDYFAYQIYQMVKKYDAGTKNSFVIPLGNMFDYFEVDANKNISDDMKLTDTELVKKNINNYYTMYVEVSANGARSKADSMFGILHGSPEHSVGGAGENGDYFAGRQIIDLDCRHFDKVLINENNYAFKLREDVLNAYVGMKNNISLRITIDQNILSSEGINFIGFTYDSGLENFKIEETIIIPLTTEVIA